LSTETGIFVPLDDDRLAAPLSLTEVATSKPNGYLQHRGIVTTNEVPALAEAINVYYATKGRPEPVIWVRAVGAETWTALDSTDLTIPDVLPDNFS
jgi:hypothetical protein